MDEPAFWDIIAKFDWDSTGDDEAVIAPAVSALTKYDPMEIEQFEDILAAKLHALDTEAHARQTGEFAWQGDEDGFSPDLFLYQRCCVVANGRALYDEVVADPSKMPKDVEFEALLYVAANAYERRTGEPFDYVPSLNYETFSNQAGWTGQTL